MSKSIKNDVITEIEIDKSKFICTLIHVNSNESALESLNKLRKQYSDATHNCYAYVINNGSIQRCSDDGEPAKTAGYPILQALLKNDLDNVLCVVTRYFGGIKLGAGGLVRAYSASAMESINNADIIEFFKSSIFEITFDFSAITPIDKLLSNYDLEIVNKEYLEKVTYLINVKDKDIEAIKSALVDITKNKIIISEASTSEISI